MHTWYIKMAQYLDNKRFQFLLLQRAELIASGDVKLPLRVNDELGKMILDLCHKLTLRSNFIRLIDREDLAQEAVLVCLNNIDMYDCSRYTNPFAYFTTTAFRAILKVITARNKTNERLWEVYRHKLQQYIILNGELDLENNNYGT